MSAHFPINSGGYPDSVDPCDPLAPWNMPEVPPAPSATCPICRQLMTRKVDWDDGWYVDEQDWYEARLGELGARLETADEGPDGRLYCSDSCRMQAMFLAATQSERDGLRHLLRGLLAIDLARSALGMRGKDCDPPDAGLYRWLRQAGAQDDLVALARTASRLYAALHGTQDNEQPTWLADVEDGR